MSPVQITDPGDLVVSENMFSPFAYQMCSKTLIIFYLCYLFFLIFLTYLINEQIHIHSLFMNQYTERKFEKMDKAG